MEAQHILKLLFAGKSTITFKSKATSKHYTFKIRKAPKAFKDERLFFVSVLNGPDNSSDFAYVGMVNSETKYFGTTTRSRYTTESTCFKAFDYTLRHIIIGDYDKTVEVLLSGKCARCGRTLTEPESIKRGIGPFCESQL